MKGMCLRFSLDNLIHPSFEQSHFLKALFFGISTAHSFLGMTRKRVDNRILFYYQVFGAFEVELINVVLMFCTVLGGSSGPPFLFCCTVLDGSHHPN